MNVTELIELLLLRHQGAMDLAVFAAFDVDDVNAVYLDLILGRYLVEETSAPDPEQSPYLLDSRVMLTPKGRQRLNELEAKVPRTRRKGPDGHRPRFR
jgi:hypothetical protein